MLYDFRVIAAEDHPYSILTRHNIVGPLLIDHQVGHTEKVAYFPMVVGVVKLVKKRKGFMNHGVSRDHRRKESTGVLPFHFLY